jgi:lipopolysaccharide transport system permease protein
MVETVPFMSQLNSVEKNESYDTISQRTNMEKNKKSILIEPTKIDREYLKDLFRFRDLFAFFAMRDIVVRYRQAFFGIAWALIRPILTMAVFTMVFGKIANLPSENINYSLFVLAGMIPWQLFSNSTIDACNCLINNSQLITKTYFPRLIIPASQLMVHLVDYAVSIILLAILLLFSATKFSLTLALLPLFFFVLVTLCLGAGLWFSALTVQYRDFRIIVPFLMQFGMFLSPVGYGTFIISEPLRYLYFMNPLVGIIDGFRWSIFGITYPDIGISILISILLSFTLLVSGYFYFRKMERTFADKL